MIMHRLIIAMLIIVLPQLVMGNTIKQLEQQLELKKYARAASTGMSMLKQQPENTRILFLTALALQKNNQPEQAQRYYQRLVTLHPELPEPKNNLAMIYLQQGKYDSAVDQLIESLNTHPAYATAWTNLSNLYKGLASEAYRKALSEDNNTTSVMDSIQLTAMTHIYALPAQMQVAQTEPLVTAMKKAPAPAVTKTRVAKSDANANTAREKAIVTSLEQWAHDWSNKDFDNYIAAYIPTYKGNKPNHEDWVAYRNSRINRPGKLQVKLKNIHIKSHNRQFAVIDFDQSYQSANYRDKVRKRVHFMQTRQGWKITKERTLAVL